MRLPGCVIPQTKMFQEQENFIMYNFHTNTSYPSSSLGDDRFWPAKEAQLQTPAREPLSACSHSLLHQEAFHHPIVWSRECGESYGITNDALFNKPLRAYLSFCTSESSYRVFLWPPSKLLISLNFGHGSDARGRPVLKVQNSQGPQQHLSEHARFSCPSDIFTLQIPRMPYKAPTVPVPFTSTYPLPFLPPPTLFVIALFTWTALQWSRCTCPLSNIWHLGPSLRGWLCKSSNALLKLARYSGGEACRKHHRWNRFRHPSHSERSNCREQRCLMTIFKYREKILTHRFWLYAPLCFTVYGWNSSSCRSHNVVPLILIHCVQVEPLLFLQKIDDLIVRHKLFSNLRYLLIHPPIYMRTLSF